MPANSSVLAFDHRQQDDLDVRSRLLNVADGRAFWQQTDGGSCGK